MAGRDAMAEIRASFFVECEELLESLHDGLTLMDNGAADSETVNVVFRAVHSIKGGAGAFGLDRLVAFAHRYETVLDALRSGRIAASAETVLRLFAAADRLGDEVRAARDGVAGAEEDDGVLAALEALGGDGVSEDEDDVLDFRPVGLSLGLDLADPTAADASWTVRFAPGRALYASGNEPLLLLRALAELGATDTACDTADLPPLSLLDPEDAWLRWTVALPGGVAEADIRAVFDFVEDLCVLEISRCPAAAEEPADCAAPDEQRSSGRTEPDVAAPSAAAADAAGSVPAAADTRKAPRGSPVGLAASVPPPPPAAGPQVSPDAPVTVRVDLDRIDRLVNLVGELVINQAMLAQSVTASGLPAHSPIAAGLEEFMLLTRDIQDSVMMIRAQPVKPLFQRMARIVREASAAVGKSVRLRTEGEGTEIDKTVIERLADPLTHMIRNAVDHGLEDREGRAAAGKPAEGVVTLSAQHRSGRVVLEVSDDGAGIDRDKVRAVAVRKGLIPADAQLTEGEVDSLLFQPGFSTAASVSNLSGRGVGMDVVKRAIQGLGGRISIASERGRGTRFSISLPLTLAVLDGMVLRVAGETLVMPLSAIVETAILSSRDISPLGTGGHVVHLRGELLPLVDLGAELGYRAPRTDHAGGIALLTSAEDGVRAALVVDQIVEQRQVVIKGLRGGYGSIPGIAAATILGDGQIALILDPADLIHSAAGAGRPRVTALAG